MTWIRGTIMNFDALTIAGMFFAAMSGAFVFATAIAQAPRRDARRLTSDRHTYKRFWEPRLLGVSWQNLRSNGAHREPRERA